MNVAVDESEREPIDARVVDRSTAVPAVPFISYGFALALVTCTIWSVDLTSPAIPAIKAGFGLSAMGAGLVVSFLFIGRLLGNLPAPRLLDSVGSPRTAMIGGLVLVIGATVIMRASTADVLYLGRILQGAGIALLVNAGLRSILSARPGRGDAMTRYGLAATVGGVLGLLSSGFMTDRFGWRSIFALSAALGIMLIILPAVSARRSSRKVATTAPAPVVAGQAVPVRSYLAPLAVNFVIFANYSIWVILPLYAQQRFGAGPGVTANLLLIITITHLVAAVPINRAIRRVGSAAVLAASVAVAVAGSLGVLVAPSVWLMAVPLVLYGGGMVGAVNASGDIVLHRGGSSSKAVGSLRQTSDLGLVIGPIAAGSIADAFSYDAPFVAFSALLVCTAAIGMLAPGVLRPRTV